MLAGDPGEERGSQLERGSRTAHRPPEWPHFLSLGAASPALEDSQLLAFDDAPPPGPYLEFLTLENIFYKIIHLIF